MRRAISEALEPRTLLSGIVVETAGDDAGNNTPTLSGSIYQAQTLRDAVNFANSQGVAAAISFDPGAFASPQTITLTHGPLSISTVSGNITIEGPGAGLLAISGNNSSRVFDLATGATAELDNLTITRGNAGQANGGAIVSDGNLTITDSVISDSSAFDGGGISASGTVDIVDSTISVNSTTGELQGFYQDGGGIFFNGGQLSIEGSTVKGNTCLGTDADGAGIYTVAANLNMANCTVALNQASGDGSGVAMYDTMGNGNATATIIDCTIADNSSTASYGGGLDDAVVLYLQGSIVSGNTGAGSPNDFSQQIYAPNAINLDNDLIGSDSPYIGPGIIVGASPLLEPLASNGGPTETMALQTGSPAIGAGATFDLPGTSTPITTDQRGDGRPATKPDLGAYQSDQLMVNTTADSTAGGLLSLRAAITNAEALSGDPTITFDPTVFASMQSIVLTQGQLTISGAVQIQAAAAGVTISGNYRSTVFYIDPDGRATLDNLTIINGAAPSGGAGGIINKGYLQLNQCTVTDNSGTSGGIQNNGTALINDSTISNNDASVGGGGIFNSGTLNLTDDVIESNQVQSAANEQGFGGGVSDIDGQITINACTISGNVASLGGGVYTSRDNSPAIVNSTIYANVADVGGGGVYATDFLTITDSTIASNLTESALQVGAAGVDGGAGARIMLVGTIVDSNDQVKTQMVPDDLSGAPFYGRYNLIGTDETGSFVSGDAYHDIISANPGLLPLAMNGGETPTLAFGRYSEAVGNGVAASFDGSTITTDQRGKPRPATDPDIGAYQYEGETSVVFANAIIYDPGTNSAVQYLVVNIEQGGQIQNISNETVTLTVASGPSAMLDGKSSISMPVKEGAAEFQNVMLGMPGTYTLQASDAVDMPAISPAFTVYNGSAPTQLSFDAGGQPGSAVVGQPDASPVIVNVNQSGSRLTTDASTVSLYLSLNGSMTPLAKATVSNGQAMFPNLLIPQSDIATGQTGPGYNYTLVAEDGSYTTATSNAFEIYPPLPINSLVFGAAPSNPIQNEALSPAIAVSEESNGVVASNDNSSVVTLTIAVAGQSGVTTLTATTRDGVAQFPFTPSLTGAYTLTATETGYISADLAFSVGALATHLVFDTQPPGIAAGGELASPSAPIVVYAEDQNDNVVTANSDSVTLSVFPHSGFIVGSTTVVAQNGIARFGLTVGNYSGVYFGLNSNVNSTNYWLNATDITNPATIPATSNSFAVVPGSATQLAVTGANAVSSGDSFDLTAQLEDVYHEVITNSSDLVSLTLESAPANGTLIGSTTEDLQGGVATFSDLSFDVAGEYTILATDENDPGAIGYFAVDVSPAQPARLAFVQQPVSTAGGAAFDPAVTVAVEDQFGNVVTDDASSVTLDLAGGASSALNGVITEPTENGVATFGSISIDQPGAGYALGATDDEEDTGAISNTFNILQPATLYVDQNAKGGNDGQDWADAFTSLQSALVMAVPGDNIDVAQGDYSPGSDPTDAFQLVDGVSLQGGYPRGGGTAPNPVDYPTVLDGMNTNYHVVTGSGADSTAQLIGFTVTGGNADGSGDNDSNSGGGFIADCGTPTLINCTFTDNTAASGGAIYVANQPSDFSATTLLDCNIINNTATSFGGGMFNSDASPTLINCLLTGNTAGESGGAIYDLSASPAISNCTFTANTTGQYGGAMENDDASDPVLTDDIFWNDSAGYGFGEISNDNVTFSGNSVPAITDCDVAASDPLFINTVAGNFQLQPTSPCIDVGDDSDPLLSGVTTDLAGNSRIIDGVVDLGAYEAQVVAVTWTGGGDGTNWTDPTNWSDDLIPTQYDNVLIGTGDLIDIPAGQFAAKTLVTASPVEVASGATLSLYGSSTFNGGLSVDDGGTLALAGSPVTVVINDLNVAPGGNVDVGDGFLVLQNASLLTVSGEIATGYNGGTWTGPGITSSTAAADVNHLTAVGVILNNDGHGNPLYGNDSPLGNFGGYAPSLNDVLVRYTYYGDANLDGKVDGSDYSLTDTGYLSQHTGWYNGDFNYSKTIDGSDYTLMDNAFNRQNASLSFALAAPLSMVADASVAKTSIGSKGQKAIASSIYVPPGQFRMAVGVPVGSVAAPAASTVDSLALQQDVVDQLKQATIHLVSEPATSSLAAIPPIVVFLPHRSLVAVYTRPRLPLRLVECVSQAKPGQNTPFIS